MCRRCHRRDGVEDFGESRFVEPEMRTANERIDIEIVGERRWEEYVEDGGRSTMRYYIGAEASGQSRPRRHRQGLNLLCACWGSRPAMSTSSQQRGLSAISVDIVTFPSPFVKHLDEHASQESLRAS